MSIQKEKLYDHCLSIVEERINRLRAIIVSAQEASNGETKSSAGDKYETSREMMQAEENKAAIQLENVLKFKKVLLSINPKVKSEEIKLGSLVDTSIGLFFLSIAMGEIDIEGGKCFLISPVSPIGENLIGKRTGEVLCFNEKEIKIFNVD